MARQFATNTTPTEAQMQYIHDLQVALVGYAQEEGNLREQMTKISTSSASEYGKRYRGFLTLMDGYNRSKNAGTGAAKINAFKDLVIDRNDTPGPKENLIIDVYNDTRAANPEAKEGSAEWNRTAWAQFEKRTGPIAGWDKHLRPNMLAMGEAFGSIDAAIADASSDSATKAGLMRLKRTNEQAKEAADAYDALRNVALEGKRLAAKGEDTTPAEVETFIASMSSLDAAAGLKTAEKYVRENVAKADEIVGSNKDTYDMLAKRADELAQRQEDLLAKTHPESERDEAARIISRPRFQAWAEANGFNIGTVVPAVPGEVYNDGTVTPVGVYIPGPDDYQALKFAQRQLGKDPDVAHPFLHNAVKTTPTHGWVEVKIPGAPEKHEDGQYHYVVDSSGARKYITPEVQAQSVAAGVDIQAFHTTKDTPPGSTELIRGKFEAPWAGDPEGSVRISQRLLTADQVVGDPMITSGGKDKPLKAFVKEYKQRRDANVQTRKENAIINEQEPFNAPAWLAQTLTPTVKSEADKAGEEEARLNAEMLRRRQEEAAQTVADNTGRTPNTVMQEIRAGSEYNPYVETAREQFDKEKAEQAKIGSKIAEGETQRIADFEMLAPGEMRAVAGAAGAGAAGGPTGAVSQRAAVYAQKAPKASSIGDQNQRAKLSVPTVSDVYATRGEREPSEQRAAYMKAARQARRDTLAE